MDTTSSAVIEPGISLMNTAERHQPILDIATDRLKALAYNNISHKRLSIEHVNERVIYQGITTVTPPPKSANSNLNITTKLTTASNNHSNCQIIKWEFSSLNNDTHYQSELIHEIDVLTQLQNCPHVITPLFIYPNNGQAFNFFSMPYFPTGNLKKFARTYSKKASITMYIEFIHLVIQKLSIAIQQLHEHGYIHGDIKLSNILINNISVTNTDHGNYGSCQNMREETLQDAKRDMEIILIDFALAEPCMNKQIEESFSDSGIINGYNDNNIDVNYDKHDMTLNKTSPTQNHRQLKGTKKYLAPECMHGAPKTIYSDYYAVGICLLELLIIILKESHGDSETLLNNLPSNSFNIASYQSSQHDTSNISSLYHTLISILDDSTHNSLGYFEIQQSKAILKKLYHHLNTLLSNQPSARRLFD